MTDHPFFNEDDLVIRQSAKHYANLLDTIADHYPPESTVRATLIEDAARIEAALDNQEVWTHVKQ